MPENTLYYGDNLKILRDYVPAESVDLIYLDPPFNSNRSYNVLFKDESGKDSQAQIQAFDDTWHWGADSRDTYFALLENAPEKVSKAMEALHTLVGENQMMAYLVMMTARLVELHRVLKSTGSLYLHCDQTAAHYLKIILDAIFGIENFRNEILWKRTEGRSHTNHEPKKWGIVVDIILYYAKSDKTPLKLVYRPNNPDYLKKHFRHVDEDGRFYQIDNLASPSPRPNLMYEYKGYQPPAKGWAISKEKMELWDKEGRLHFPKSKEGRIRRKRYLDELEGETVQNLWDDIGPISSQAAERLGYPTQKPLSLLERIILASSNPGDVVLDPFAGCGTAVAAAQKLGRNWLGIDITHLGVALIKYRLNDMFGLQPGKDYKVVGEPTTVDDARALAKDGENDGRYQFQFWALSLVQAKPLGGTEGSKQGKKGSDKGIDGVITFIAGEKAQEKAQRVLVQVKSGKVKSGDIRDLVGTVEREKAAIGVFITLEAPTRDMEKEALSAGVYQLKIGSASQHYPKIQLLTIEQLLQGKRIEMPSGYSMFKTAPRIAADVPEQRGLWGE